jgi:hypothetical protein
MKAGTHRSGIESSVQVNEVLDLELVGCAGNAAARINLQVLLQRVTTAPCSRSQFDALTPTCPKNPIVDVFRAKSPDRGTKGDARSAHPAHG